jgi:DNA-binding NtrC family response regulator
MSSAAEKARILVVDDAVDTLEVLRRNLTSAGYQVFTAPDVETAIRILDTTPVDLIITDLKMPRVGGMDLIRHVRENMKDIEVVVITGYPSIEGAVEAVKTGAEDYLSKPFTDQELFTAVRRALEKLDARRKDSDATRLAEPPFEGIIGESKAMQRVFDAIRKAAATRVNVLITGESGTGKELVARAIHYSSPRAAAPFVPVNCGGIPEGLLESELFGHVKGSFTGATDTRVGFFQTADGGTIFLDEISETTPGMQVKLLRVLEDQMIYMIGSRRSQKVDVRVLAATNKHVLGLIENGTFREDLYYRLNVITIDIPPLRDRADDIISLTHHFAEKHAADMGAEKPRFSERALQALRAYPWPGNVRELENTVHRMMVMTESPSIDAPDLPAAMRFSALRGAGADRTLAQVETDHIRNVLASTDGNKTRAAQILGIDRKTLREKLKRIHEHTRQHE